MKNEESVPLPAPYTTSLAKARSSGLANALESLFAAFSPARNRHHPCAGTLTPVQLVKTLLERIDAYPDKAVFISRIQRETIIAQTAALDVADTAKSPCSVSLSFARNIDVAGLPPQPPGTMPTVPTQDFTVVARLRAAGAILLAKANLDQFATGRTATARPWRAALRLQRRAHLRRFFFRLAAGAGLAGVTGHGHSRLRPRVRRLQATPSGLKLLFGLIPATGMSRLQNS